MATLETAGRISYYIIVLHVAGRGTVVATNTVGPQCLLAYHQPETQKCAIKAARTGGIGVSRA